MAMGRELFIFVLFSENVFTTNMKKVKTLLGGLIAWFIDFNGISTRVGLFYA